MVKRIKEFFSNPLFEINDSAGRINLFAMSVPLFFQLIFNLMLGTINTIVLTYVSDEAVTAVNVANTVLNVPVILLTMVTNGLLVILSYSLGKGNGAAGDACVTGIAINIISAVAISIICFTQAPVFMQLMGLSGRTAAQAVLYFRIRSLFLVFQALAVCYTAILRANGFAKPTMISGMIINIINAAMSVMVVCGWIMPNNKIAGVSFAAVIGQIAGFIYAYIALKRKYEVKQKGRFTRQLSLRILKIGVPGGFSLLAYNISVMVSTAILTSLGSNIINTKIFVSNVANYSYLFGYATAQSCALMIGRYAGAGKYNAVKQLYKKILLFTPLLNVCLSLLIFIFSNRIMHVFTNDPAIIAAAHALLFIDIAVEAERGLNHVGENSLCGVGDTLFTSMVSISSCIFINMLGCWFLCIKLGLGLYGYYAAVILDEGVRSIIYYCRWRKSRWILGVEKLNC